MKSAINWLMLSVCSLPNVRAGAGEHAERAIVVATARSNARTGTNSVSLSLMKTSPRAQARRGAHHVAQEKVGGIHQDPARRLSGDREAPEDRLRERVLDGFAFERILAVDQPLHHHPGHDLG